MSITPGNLSSNSIVLNTQNRSEFIDRFKQNHNERRNEHNSINYHQNRWDYLHDLNKLQQLKLEEQRQKIYNERETNIFTECTFTPKLNKSVNYYGGSIPTSNNNRLETEPYSGGLLNRQETWNQKKFLHIETLKQNKNTKELDQCFFRPEVNPQNKLNKSHLKSVTSKVVEDPESYNMYVSRLERKRKEDEAKRVREKSLPGSGHIWNSNPKKYNLSYDYTKHEHTTRSPSKKNSIYSLQKPITPKKFSSNTIISHPNCNRNKNFKQSQLNNRDLYYDYMYNSQREEKKMNDSRYCNKTKSRPTQSLILNDKIEYGQAIELLHNELYSFPLMADE